MKLLSVISAAAVVTMCAPPAAAATAVSSSWPPEPGLATWAVAGAGLAGAVLWRLGRRALHA